MTKREEKKNVLEYVDEYVLDQEACINLINDHEYVFTKFTW